MISTPFLMVPIQVDALLVEQPMRVVDAMADFSRLPFYDAKVGTDVNADIAYISEDLVSAPFQENFPLESGVHLHWALPDALTRSRDVRGRTLRLMSINQLEQIPKNGVELVIVAQFQGSGLLHFRYFDATGTNKLCKSESEFLDKSAEIESLKKYLAGLPEGGELMVVLIPTEY